MNRQSKEVQTQLPLKYMESYLSSIIIKEMEIQVMTLYTYLNNKN